MCLLRNKNDNYQHLSFPVYPSNLMITGTLMTLTVTNLCTCSTQLLLMLTSEEQKLI